MIDQLFERGGIELLLARQINQHAWVEIAGARTHDHSATWGQSHAGVERFAILDGGDAGAIAEMGDDQAARRILSKLAHDRFTREAVEAVALDALYLQFLVDRKHACHFRQIGMKGGVETCHLRKPGKKFLREPDDGQAAIMMGRSGNAAAVLARHAFDAQ